MRPRLPSQGGLFPARTHTATAKTDVTNPLTISSTQQYRAIPARTSAGLVRTAISAAAQEIHRIGSTKAAASSPHLQTGGIPPVPRLSTWTSPASAAARSRSEITIFVTPDPSRRTSQQADAEKSISFYAFPFRRTPLRLAECPNESNQKYKHPFDIDTMSPVPILCCHNVRLANSRCRSPGLPHLSWHRLFGNQFLKPRGFRE